MGIMDMASILVEEKEDALLTKCTWENCSMWAFACFDNRPFRPLEGVCSCKYHFLVETYAKMNNALNDMPLLVVTNDLAQAQKMIEDRMLMAKQLNVIARELKTLKEDEIPPAERALFRRTFGGLFSQ